MTDDLEELREDARLRRQRKNVHPPADEVSVKGTGASGTHMLALGRNIATGLANSMRPTFSGDMKQRGLSGFTVLLLFVSGFAIGWWMRGEGTWFSSHRSTTRLEAKP